MRAFGRKPGHRAELAEGLRDLPGLYADAQPRPRPGKALDAADKALVRGTARRHGTHGFTGTGRCVGTDTSCVLLCSHIAEVLTG